MTVWWELPQRDFLMPESTNMLRSDVISDWRKMNPHYLKLCFPAPEFSFSLLKPPKA